MKRVNVGFWTDLSAVTTPTIVIIELKERPLYSRLHKLRDIIKMEAWDEFLDQQTKV
jgi:hypothetical protein